MAMIFSLIGFIIGLIILGLWIQAYLFLRSIAKNSKETNNLLLRLLKQKRLDNSEKA